MRTIPLTQGKVALINDADYDWLMCFNWCAHKVRGGGWRARGYIGKRYMYMHRLLTDAAKDMDVDHRNHDGLDNQRSNLRICTRRQNIRNMLPKGGTSKYKGVCRIRERWIAYIMKNYRQRTIGLYDSEKDAALAYNKAALELFGEFAYINRI